MVARHLDAVPPPTYLALPRKGATGQRKRRYLLAQQKWSTEMFGPGYRAALERLQSKLRFEAARNNQMAVAA